MLTQKCNKCSGTMVLRTGKFGKFYGCSNYPKCKNIAKYIPEKSSIPVNTPPIDNTGRVWSVYQKTIFDYISTKFKQNLRIEATAGSGKSTVLGEIASILVKSHPNSKIIALVFGKDAKNDLASKIPGLEVRTTHSLALKNVAKTIRNAYKIIDADNKKYLQIFDDYLLSNEDLQEILKPHKSNVVTIIGGILNNLLDCSLESIQYISDIKGITFNGDSSILINCINWVYNEGIKTYNSCLSFDEMLYIAANNPAICEKYDYILLDESQDTNAAQMRLLQNSMTDTSKIVFVGDESQSIFGFRWALSDAMNILQDTFKADRLPLSVSYRLPRLHVQYVKGLFPDIEIEAAPNAIEGSLEFGKFDKYLQIISDKSLVLCRNNAPLVKPAFRLLSEGRKVIIKGKDIGIELINFILRIKRLYNANTLTELLEGLRLYATKESEKLLKMNQLRKLEAIQDKLQCIESFAENSETIDSMINTIDNIFSDNENGGIVFSSVHKAKGLESDEVYILNPGLMPSKKAKTDEEKRQESNIMFVAYTRSKNKMFIVDDEK